MNNNSVIINNVSKEEAYNIFNNMKGTVCDCNKSTLSVSGNANNVNKGWSVTRINFD